MSNYNTNAVKILTPIENDENKIVLYTELDGKFEVGDKLFIMVKDQSSIDYLALDSMFNSGISYTNNGYELLEKKGNRLKLNIQYENFILSGSSLIENNCFIGKVYIKNATIYKSILNSVLLYNVTFLNSSRLNIKWKQGIIFTSNDSISTVDFKKKYTDDTLILKTELITEKNGNILIDSYYTKNNNKVGTTIINLLDDTLTLNECNIYEGLFKNCKFYSVKNIINGGLIKNSEIYDDYTINDGYIYYSTLKDNKIKWNNGTWENINSYQLNNPFICKKWNNGIWNNGYFPNTATWVNGRFNDGSFNGITWFNGVFNSKHNNSKFIQSVWENGTFNNGIFELSSWSGGTFNNGIISGSTWYTGNFNDGTFTESIWNNGNFNDGTFINSKWSDGTFNNGNFNNSSWSGGTFKDGTMINSSWENGNFHNGKFQSSIWKYGNFFNGSIFNSDWINGNMYYGKINNINWYYGNFFNGIVNSIIWSGGTWYNGIFNYGVFYSGNWLNGSFNNGFFGRNTVANWYNGNFYGGDFSGSTWENGIFYSGYLRTPQVVNNKNIINKPYVQYNKDTLQNQNILTIRTPKIIK
jgi:uncharacterized protein YjbI with pentapeptide repeats